MVITKVIAHAAINTGALCLNKFSMFLLRRKPLRLLKKKVTTTIKKKNTYYSNIFSDELIAHHDFNAQRQLMKLFPKDLFH